MSSQMTNYQCPNCLAGLRFDGGKGKLLCDHCDNEFEVELVEQLFADKEEAAVSAGVEPQWDITETNNFTDEEAAHLRGYICSSCAAEIICDDTTVATSCPYCGNPTVIPGQLSSQGRPDLVIPFKLDKKAAIAALKNYYKGKKFLPKSFSDENHLEEIKGVYVPFWLFDGQADADMRFRGTTSRTYTSGNYRVTETSHYRITRSANVSFEKVPADASSKMPDTHMDSVEPFDYNELKPFSTAYLPGFLADKYDVKAEDCVERANTRITNSTEEAIANTVSGYATLTREYSRINLRSGDVKYVLLPVWMLSTKWNNKNYLFTMNGQTGKLIGDLPVDKGRYFTWFIGIAGGLSVILSVISLFI
ncbi:MAG: hypothetical protein FWG88_09830 [Oscillospiraceae bacterium]|nr:hypothetical protein [Oscillospiraceae bacterium]